MSAERFALDDALEARGEDVVLRRQVAAGDTVSNIDVTCRARVDIVNADEIGGKVSQADLKIIMSPTQILDSQWPGGVPDHPVVDGEDVRMPRATDFVVCRGKQREIRVVDPKFTPEWCRINLVAAG